MEKNFKVTSRTENAQYEYDNSEMFIQGTFVKDAETGDLQNVSGTCYRKDEHGQHGEYFGNFNGYLRDGEVKYSMSEMSHTDANKVWAAVEEIEPEIVGGE